MSQLCILIAMNVLNSEPQPIFPLFSPISRTAQVDIAALAVCENK